MSTTVLEQSTTEKAKTKTSKVPALKTEEDILKKLHLTNKGDKLSATDRKNIAAAAREASKALRKSNPQLAQHLYYIHYKHTQALNSGRKAKKN